MENNNQKKYQNRVPALFIWGICFILFLPIIILPPSFQPSDWSRTTLFRITLTLLASFLLFKYFYKKDFSFSIPKWNFSVYLPFLLLSGFVLTLVLSTIFSQDIRFSIFGSPSRAGGVLNYLFLFIFVIFLSIFIQKNDWKKLFKTILAVGLLASSLAFIQSISIFKNIFISYETSGVPSFFGNSTFLAIFMLFMVFFSFVLFIQEKTKKIKIAYFCFFLIFLFTILITGARAVYLATLIAFLYFILFYPVKKSPLQTFKTQDYKQIPQSTIKHKNYLVRIYTWIFARKLKTLKVIIVAFLILTIAIVVYVNISPKLPSFIENNPKLSYLAHNRLSIKLVLTDLLDIRLSVWKITLNAIKEKPILGWGPENFYIGFEKHYDPSLFNLNQQWWMMQRWWDRPHNIFLDIAVSSGIISVIIYFLFWIVLFWRLQEFKNHQRKSAVVGENQSVMAHGIQAMFIGYFIALFFNFDIFPTYILSFFFIGYSFYLISEQSEKKIVYPLKTNFAKNKFIYIPLLLLLISFILFWNIKPLYLVEEIVYALNRARVGKCDRSLAIMEGVWRKNNLLSDYAGLKYADTAKKCVSLENEVFYSGKSLEALKVSAKFRPKFTGTWLLMGSFTDILAAREQNPDNKNKLLQEARTYLEKAKELSPKRQEIILEMEKNYLIASDYQTMIKLGEDCIKIDPNVSECYWYLGIAEIFSGEQEKGKKHIQDSREKGPFSPYWVQLGVAYISQKNYEDAAEAYRHAIRYNDWQNPGYHAVLAFLYKQLGDYEKAKIEAMEVFNLQPENKEVPEFLRLLLGLNPNDPTLHSSLGYVYNQIGETEKAIQEYLVTKSIYAKAVAREPKNPHYHFNLAGVCKILKEYDQAYKEAIIAEKLNWESYHEKAINLIKSFPEVDYWGKYLREENPNP
ncbi:MAG: O-antigen ligase family protein [bacterium]|nr:O-antigen ligase family protein [bacterium]